MKKLILIALSKVSTVDTLVHSPWSFLDKEIKSYCLYYFYLFHLLINCAYLYPSTIINRDGEGEEEILKKTAMAQLLPPKATNDVQLVSFLHFPVFQKIKEFVLAYGYKEIESSMAGKHGTSSARLAWHSESRGITFHSHTGNRKSENKTKT